MAQPCLSPPKSYIVHQIFLCLECWIMKMKTLWFFRTREILAQQQSITSQKTWFFTVQFNWTGHFRNVTVPKSLLLRNKKALILKEMWSIFCSIINNVRVYNDCKKFIGNSNELFFQKFKNNFIVTIF